MAALIIASVLLGAILQAFFRVLVLVPASATLLAVVSARSAYFGYGLLRPVLEFVVLTAALQMGYASTLLIAAISGLWQRMSRPP